SSRHACRGGTSPLESEESPGPPESVVGRHGCVFVRMCNLGSASGSSVWQVVACGALERKGASRSLAIPLGCVRFLICGLLPCVRAFQFFDFSAKPYRRHEST